MPIRRRRRSWPLFTRQGFQESSSAAPFEDYLALGMDKTPMLVSYEAQLVAFWLAHPDRVKDDMVILYPTPTVFSKHVLIPFPEILSWMERLEKYIYLGKNLDEALDAKAKALDATDAQRARVVREELLFYTRQKVTDLLTQMAVNIQGYLALDLLRKNNFELIKGVDRATTTTVAAQFSFEDAQSEAQTYQALRDYTHALSVNGGTAIYSALDTAYTLAAKELARAPDRVVTVVLLTDGENNKGMSYEEFRSRLQEHAKHRRVLRCTHWAGIAVSRCHQPRLVAHHRRTVRGRLPGHARSARTRHGPGTVALIRGPG